MRVLLISVGSRGDNEPFVALADQLLSRGHDVVQCLQKDYVKLAPTRATATGKTSDSSVPDTTTTTTATATDENVNNGGTYQIIELPFTTNDFYRYTANPSHGQDHPNPRMKFVGIIADVIGELVLPCTNQILNELLLSPTTKTKTKTKTNNIDAIVCSSLARQAAFLLSEALGGRRCGGVGGGGASSPPPPVYVVHLQPLLPTNEFPHYSNTDEFIDCLFGSSSSSSSSEEEKTSSDAKPNEDENKDPPKKKNYIDWYWELERYQFDFLQQRLQKTYNEVVVNSSNINNNDDDDDNSDGKQQNSIINESNMILSFEGHQRMLAGKSSNVYIVNAFSNELIPIPTDAMTSHVYNVGALGDAYVPNHPTKDNKDEKDTSWSNLEQFLLAAKKKKNDNNNPTNDNKPICIGFGSMPYDSEKVKGLLQVVKDLNQRVVLVGKALDISTLRVSLSTADDDQTDDVDDHHNEQQTELTLQWLNESVYHIDSVQYAKLLPYVSVMVCHGGAGAVHAALRAGCAVVVSPLMGDQFTFAKLLEKKGLGAQAGSLMTTMTMDEFRIALKIALTCTDAATALGMKLRQQTTGVEMLTQIMEDNLVKKDLSG